MDFLFIFLSVLIAVVLFQLFRSLSSSSSNHPPGPKPLPILGNLLQLGDNPHQLLANLAKIHGPILTLRLGQITTIVISSPLLAKEILKTHDLNFCNRKCPEAVKASDHHVLGIAWMPVSSSWINMRRICKLHIFAAQKLDANHNQDLRREKINELLQDAERHRLSSEAMDIGEVAFKTMINVLSNTIFSVDLADVNIDYGFGRGFKNLLIGLMDEVGRLNLADFYPLLRKIDPQGVRRRTTYLLSKLLDLFDVIINQRLEMRKKEDKSATTIDFLDTLLNISKEDSERLSIHDIKHLFADLFVAGSTTTSSTLEWAMSELLRNPNILSKARAELEESIGQGNFVKESDIQNLPYLEAVIKESLRLRPTGPLLLPHQSSIDTEIAGFTIPGNAQVLINAWAIGRDPNLWKEPSCFVPERFLESNINYKGNDFSFIPFGSGRRICPGIPLATRMLPLMLGSLIHSFDWKLENGKTFESLDMEERFSLSLQKAQPLRMIPIPPAA